METDFSHWFLPAPNPPRQWDELMLDEACRRLLDEVSLPGWAPGGRVEFKRTLVVSFFFKFYLTVLKKLGKDSKDVSVEPGEAKHLCAPGTLVFWDLGS